MSGSLLFIPVIPVLLFLKYNLSMIQSTEVNSCGFVVTKGIDQFTIHFLSSCFSDRVTALHFSQGKEPHIESRTYMSLTPQFG